jgi:riboflavin synthase
VVREAEKRGKSLRLTIDPGGWSYARKARIGDSVSVAGVCLTLVKPSRNAKSSRPMEFDLVPETLDKTTLGSLTPGDPVNLEHAATATTLFGGHIVQGHVDGVGRISRVQRGDDWRIWIDLPKPIHIWMVSKGSITVDGVSLTIAGLTRRGLWVALIPETLAKTTLTELAVGDKVNIEADVVAKMVARAKELGTKRRAQTAKRKSKPRRR